MHAYYSTFSSFIFLYDGFLISFVYKIEEVRKQTKAEKKRVAMAVRKKQLVALGMTVSNNEI